MASYTAIYQNHAAALGQHKLGSAGGKNTKQDSGTNPLSAAVRRAFPPSPPAPFSYNATPRPNITAKPTQDVAMRKTSALNAPGSPDLLQVQARVKESGAYQNYSQAHTTTTTTTKPQRQTHFRCFGLGCKRRSPASSTNNAFCRKANLTTNSHNTSEDMLISSPIFSTPHNVASTFKNTKPAVRPITPFVPRRPNASGRGPSLKHPQPHQGWMSDSVTDLTNRNSEALVPHKGRDTQGSLASFAGAVTAAVPDRLQRPIVTDCITEVGATSSRKLLRHTDVPLPKIRPLRPNSRKLLSIYKSEGCWGCEDAKAIRDKATGLCRKCELYLVPCIDWTPEEKAVETLESTSQVHRKLRKPSTGREEEDSPTLGDSEAFVRIIGSREMQSQVPRVNTTALGVEEDNVSPPRSHFPDYTYTSASSRIPHISHSKLTPDQDEGSDEEVEIQDLCKFWQELETSFRTPEGQRLTTLHPTAKGPGKMKCIQGPPTPERVSSPKRADAAVVASRNSLASRRSQGAAISGLCVDSDSSMAMRSWIDFNDQDSSPELGVESPRPTSSIYSLYLDL